MAAQSTTLFVFVKQCPCGREMHIRAPATFACSNRHYFVNNAVVDTDDWAK